MFRVEVPPECTVCGRDVSDDPANFHYGACPVCRRETRHVIPFHGCPWHCREAHLDDATACCICGREIEEDLVHEFIAKGGPVKRMCLTCDPLAKARLLVFRRRDGEALLDLLVDRDLKESDKRFIVWLLLQ